MAKAQSWFTSWQKKPEQKNTIPGYRSYMVASGQPGMDGA